MSIVEAEHPAGVPVSVSVEIGGREIIRDREDRQAGRRRSRRPSGETVVLGTAQGRTEAREGADFFPLTVDVEERMYAAGKIPGGFFKREGRPTERAILTARMIDRPVRPLWPKGYRNETQCVATVFSADLVVPHDILAINAVSAALTVSPLPFLGPIGAVRMGLIEGKLVINPTLEETEHSSDLDLIVVGTKDGLTMVEAGANHVPENVILEALEIAHREIVKLCDAQLELRAKAGKPSGSTRQSPSGSRASTAARSGTASRRRASAMPARSSRRSSARRAAKSRWTPTRPRSSASCRSARRWPSCSRSSARSRPRRPFASSSRATCAGSPRPSRTRRS